MNVYRVSHVERFRQFEQDEEADASSLLADIRGESEPSTAMLAGTAFHKAIEQAYTGVELDSIEQDGFRFAFTGDLSIELAPIREVRASKTYMVDGKPIMISGQLDQIVGRRIEDHKTTARFDPERYMDGYQWRLYLEIFGADVFRWNIFELADQGQDDDGTLLYEVRSQHRLEQHRYPALGEDCQALVERFARFVRERL